MVDRDNAERKALGTLLKASATVEVRAIQAYIRNAMLEKRSE